MNKASKRNNVELLRAMNEVILWLNDERAYESWILTVPDEADDDDFEWIAERDEDMDHVCRRFRQLVSHYGKDGWFTKLETRGKPCELRVYGAEEWHEALS